ncbi:U3 small nucleolar RNA-associated protein 13 [Batrachochytrium dendrobatidis]|nr:U3 small nucleolar RNA-associated protein 13 [Batrachochytrium dendrobatidis]
MASQSLELKTSFKVDGTIESIFTGGKASLSADSSQLFTMFGDDVVVTDLDSGVQKLRIQGATDTVTSFALKPDGTHIVIAYQSLLLKVFDTVTGEMIKSFKAHEAPVLAMDVDSTSTLVSTGSADSTVKVWDVDRGYCTHNFKGHGGIVSVVKFHPNPKNLLLVSGSDDCKICLWDLNSRLCIAALTSHVSVIRGLDFSPDGEFLFSGSRDKVINKWNLKALELTKTIPIFESIEALSIVNHNNTHVICTGGDKGIVRLWDMETGELILAQEKDINSHHQISGMIWSESTQTIVAVTSDQNILFYDVNSLKRTRQIAGYNEEVLDICFVGETESHLAVVTNTEQIRIYDIEKRDCDIVFGHSDIVLCVVPFSNGKLMASGSKDHTAMLWSVNPTADPDMRYVHLGTCIGHTDSVTAVAAPCSNMSSAGQFIITGSQDRTIKMWEIGDIAKCGNSETKFKAKYTFQAHDKDIQSIAVAPNNKLFVSGALDRTAKMWSVADGTLVGTFKGHKRGIWCVKFSPIDQIVATASTDKSIKLWNINDFTCIRTFEGHLNTVLNVSFLTAGMQLVSTGSDGLVKLWTIKDNECVATLDNHNDRIWGLAVDRSEQHVLSGSSDSTITIWKDVTAEEKKEEAQKSVERIIKEQDLSLLLLRKDYKSAVLLAMQLDQPYRILTILSDVRKAATVSSTESTDAERVDTDLDVTSVTGSKSLDALIQNLPSETLEQLLLYIRDWNTHSKHVQVTQALLYLILKGYNPSVLIELPKAKEILEGLLPYNERHFVHANELLKKSHVLEYTLKYMDSLMNSVDSNMILDE